MSLFSGEEYKKGENHFNKDAAGVTLASFDIDAIIFVTASYIILKICSFVRYIKSLNSKFPKKHIIPQVLLLLLSLSVAKSSGIFLEVSVFLVAQRNIYLLSEESQANSYHGKQSIK